MVQHIQSFIKKISLLFMLHVAVSCHSEKEVLQVYNNYKFD